MQRWKANLIKHIKAIAGIVGLGLAILGAVVFSQGDQWREENIGLVWVHGAYWTSIVYLIWIILTRESPDFLGVPRVIKLVRDQEVLLVEQSPWLSLDVLTAVYIVDNDVERFVCVGKVVNVQMNKLVQIELSPDERGDEVREEMWDALNQAEKTSILVKPGLYPGGS